MSNIGFDFGTTNSSISYYDKEQGSITSFRPEASDNAYVPTVISYGKRVTEIGNAAKSEVGSPNVYSRFKLRLGSMYDQPMPGQTKSAHEAARDYIDHLLKLYEKECGAIDQIVMTIPEAWYKETTNVAARDNINRMFQEELKRSNVRFQSEPVAAAAYYCWRYQNQAAAENPDQKPYDGLLLIIDFGGGTLDVTLCDVKRGARIRVLDSCGFGEDQNQGGCAGSAFDEEVIRLICKENDITLSEEDFPVARDELEQKLIAKASYCKEVMEEYFEFPEGMEDEPLFSLNSLHKKEVCCKHLQMAFDKINRPVLEQAITQMKVSGAMDPEHIRIAMVGGFSNFCCVEAAVRELFGSKSGMADKRFSNLLSTENRALAISKGAALIADGKMHVDPTFPYELGIVAGEVDEELHYHDVFIPLIHKGQLTDEYVSKPVYAKERVHLMAQMTNQIYARMYIGSGSERQKFALDEDVAQVFPIAGQDSEYELGLTVDDNMIPRLWTRNSDGKERSTPLNRILEKILVRKNG